MAALSRASEAEAKLSLTRAEVIVLQDGIKATLEMKDLKDLSSERLVLLLLKKKKNCGSSTFVAALRDAVVKKRKEAEELTVEKYVENVLVEKLLHEKMHAETW